MKFLKANIVKIPMLLVMLMAYFLVIQNTLLNKHIHVLPHGVIVEHSHPLCNNSHEAPTSENHHHSKAELLFFGMFSDVGAVLVTACLLIAFLSLPKIKHYVAYRDFDRHIILHTRLADRAPPVLA
ncbi:hypothetical protein EMN47_06955 [Prolixibacteraceae bacterium JC049]|nr:hypothetical protein [Prolixibacteraceae bacterium JC049]